MTVQLLEAAAAVATIPDGASVALGRPDATVIARQIPRVDADMEAHGWLTSCGG